MTDRGATPSWAKVGAKVVCIDASMGREDHLFAQPQILVVGATYTIYRLSEMFEAPSVQVSELPFHLVSRDGTEYDAWMRLSRFRPLVTRSQAQDVAQFRKLLAHQPKGVDA